jgi:hypothetical protein
VGKRLHRKPHHLIHAAHECSTVDALRFLERARPRLFSLK